MCSITTRPESRWGDGYNTSVPIGDHKTTYQGFPGGAMVKNPLANAGNTGIPGSGRSHEGGNVNQLQYSCLGNPLHRGAWRATVRRITRVRHEWAYLSTQNHKPAFRVLRGQKWKLGPPFLETEQSNSVDTWIRPPNNITCTMLTPQYSLCFNKGENYPKVLI